MKIGEMTGRQILDAIAQGLEEAARPFDREEEARDKEPRSLQLAEDASGFDRTL